MTVQLKNGAEIVGEVLDRRTERVVVDLGFTVVSIPAGEIVRIVARGADQPERDSSSGDALFRTAVNPQVATVQENVARLAAAVVQIRTPSGLGSGFVIHPDGYVVTNEHVIAGEYEITVTVYERAGDAMEKAQFTDVRILALDPRLDLALLKIESSEKRPFVSVPVGESQVIEGGETVFAIGSPLGLERTVSQGIVSLKNRPLGGQLYIQTTTQINPGNSGGPLFNLRGEVVGVNNMKAMMVGVEGVNFAIPSATLKAFLRNRDAFAFDTRNPNAGFRYLEPPRPARAPKPEAE
ncbi:MAG: trypsin-like peptidase domain-containing protein [Opitutaceae bacterium]|nr:trypsin-like peptidase domain-containing protein [Opitutaceae bacterium]